MAYTTEWVGIVAMETNYPHKWALLEKIMEDSTAIADSDSGGSVTGGIGGEDQGNNSLTP